ncbi:hypothetical protein ACJX0J_023585 [Zea mays]
MGAKAEAAVLDCNCKRQEGNSRLCKLIRVTVVNMSQLTILIPHLITSHIHKRQRENPQLFESEYEPNANSSFVSMFQDAIMHMGNQEIRAHRLKTNPSSLPIHIHGLMMGITRLVVENMTGIPNIFI